jgi:hypothetical protein
VFLVPGTNKDERRYGARSSGVWPFLLLVIAMLEMTDFFQKEAQGCIRLAAEATRKNDREYWLRLAQRWEWLVQQNRGAEVETIRPRTRSMVEKRFAKRRAA